MRLGTCRSCQAAQINGLPSNSTTPFPVDKRFATLIHGLSNADVSIVGYVLMHVGRIPNAHNSKRRISNSLVVQLASAVS